MLLRLALLMRIELLEGAKDSKLERGPNECYASLLDAWNGLGEVDAGPLKPLL